MWLTAAFPDLRSVVCITLSCWFGFLACVLGCAKPTLAAAVCEQNQISSALKFAREAVGSNAAGGAPCCHPRRSSSGGPHQNNHTGVSCCPLAATLIQKQDPTSRLHSDTGIALLAPLTLHSTNRFPASGEVLLPALWYAGRDILLQAHILRI